MNALIVRESGVASTALAIAVGFSRTRFGCFRLSHGPRHSKTGCHCRHSGHSHNVARQHIQIELLIDPVDAAEHGLADSPDCLGPTEMLFDALADPLADLVPVVAGGAAVDRALATVLKYYRNDMGRACLSSAKAI